MLPFRFKLVYKHFSTVQIPYISKKEVILTILSEELPKYESLAFEIEINKNKYLDESGEKMKFCWYGIRRKKIKTKCLSFKSSKIVVYGG